MAKQISSDGYAFVFSDDVIDAFVFDTPKYKIPSMKAVDIIAEFPDEYLLTLRLNDIMKQAIPTGIPNHTQWKRPIVKNIAVVNVSTWNASNELKRYGSCSLSI